MTNTRSKNQWKTAINVETLHHHQKEAVRADTLPGLFRGIYTGKGFKRYSQAKTY